MTEQMHDAFLWRIAYARGYRPARYPLPAIPVKVGFEPSGIGGMRGIPYIYVTTVNRCLTFWKGIGLIEEWYDRDGFHHLLHRVQMREFK